LLTQFDRRVAQNPEAELPHALKIAPDVYPHLAVVWLVFNLVRNSRFLSEFGIGRIAMSEMTTALDEFQVEEPDLRIYYIRLLQGLDTAYIAFLNRLRK
jgi:hypothetical protein